jgi:hypothetical protein
VGFVEGETGSCSETGVKCDIDATEEISIKVEEVVDIKVEIHESIIFPPFKTEQEVRLWDVCVRWWQLMLLGHLLPQKRNCEITLHYFRFVLCFGCHVAL